MKKRLVLQLAAIASAAALFAVFNLSIYTLITGRLENNFSGTDQAKMIDVGRYLPHEEESDLARVEASLKLTDGLPVLDGAAALFPVYAAIADSVYPPGSVTYEGGVFSDDNYYGENFAEDSKVQYKNTVRGYKAIADGETDLFFCAAPSAEQREYAEGVGAKLVYVPVGREAFVFFVNRENPVDSLTADQIRDIYAGEYRSWAELGGADRVINPVTRLKGSGSQSAMEAFMGDRSIGRKSIFAVTGASIGFSFRFYMKDMVDNGQVKLISVDGVYPDEDSIRDGSYPIVTQFYAVYREDNENENVPRLVEWLLSEEGQRLVEESGYVSVRDNEP